MKLNFYKSFFLLIAVLFLAASCEKDYATIEEIDQKAISDYFKSNNLNEDEFSDTLGIRYKVINVGSGDSLNYREETPIIFTVKSLDGSFAALDTFAVYNRFADRFGYVTLRGMKGSESFREVIKNASLKLSGEKLTKGGEVRLIIPSRLAYGRNGYSYFEGYKGLSLSGNSSLDVTVKVIGNLEKYEDAMIQKYIQSNNLGSFTKTNSGLYYKIVETGNGSVISRDSTVKTAYTGKLLNGKVFETVLADNPASFYLNDLGLREGWKEGVPMIRKGGTIRLIMPSRLAYGIKGAQNPYTGATDIPPFSPLDFEIKVIN